MITEEQRNNFLISDPDDVIISFPQDPSIPKWNPPTSMIDDLRPEVWTGNRIRKAERSLSLSLGTNDLIPPGQVESQNRLNTWWSTEGQHLPRHVLDQIGIVGGEKVPTIAELDKIDRKRQVDIVKDFFNIRPDPQMNDPLAQITVADPSDVDFRELEPSPEVSDIIKAADTEDLEKIHRTLQENVLDFDDKIFRAVDDEIRIRKAIDEVIIPEMQERPLTTLIGTDFFNKLAVGLPEFTSRKGFNPIEALLEKKGLTEKGEASILFRAAGRVRAQLAQQDPRLLTKIGLSSGEIGATLIQFALLPDPSKLKAFVQLPKVAKAAIGVGTKSGLITALQAPRSEETFDDRAKEIALATGIGALTGVILQTLFTGINKIFTTIKDLPVSQQAEQILFNNPGLKMSKDEVVLILKTLKSTNPEQFQKVIAFKPVKAVPSRVIRKLPTGFRVAAAEIEKPFKAAGKIAKAIGKKEAAAVVAAKALAKKALPVKPVKPTKILTKAEALSFQESNLVTGEEGDIRIVADAKTRRSVQAVENKLATLKTKLAQQKADKKVELVRATEIEIVKKQDIVAKLKEKQGIKLETTIEGAREKITKLRAATEFKESLRTDAISMVQAIPREVQAAFIKRASKVKTPRGLHKLAEEIDVGIERVEKRNTIGQLRDTISDVIKRNQLGKVRLGKIPSPQREQILELVDSVDVKKLSEAKEQDLLSLQKHAQRLSSQLAGNLESLDSDVDAALRLPNERIRQLNRLSAKSVSEMDVDDIRLITDSIQLLAGQAKLKGQLLTKQGLKPLDQAVPKAVNELAPTQRSLAKPEITPTERTVIQKTFDFVKKAGKLDDSHLDTLVELSTDPKKRDIITQILDTDLHEGMRNVADKQTDWIAQTVKRFKSIGLTNIKQLEEEFTVTLAGQKIKVTVDELISLEMDTRSIDNLRSRLNSRGIQIGEKVLRYPEGIDRLDEFNKALSNIRNKPALMGFANWISELNPQQAQALNETFLRERGYEIAREPNYYPRSRVLPKRVEGGRADISVPPEEQGRYQPRSGGTAPLRLRKASGVFLEGIESDSFVHGMTIPLRNARLLISNGKFQRAMIDAGRKQELDNIITILRRTQGITTSRSTLDLFGSRIQRGVVSSALGLRVSTIGTQAMSYPAAFAEINPRYMRPMIPVGKGTISRIEEDSALMKLRWMSRRIGIEIGTSASADAFNMLFFGETKKLTNKALKGLVFGDRQAIGNIYNHGVAGEILNEPRNGKNVDPFEWEGRDVADLPVITDIDSKAARYAAARRLEYVVRRSQPMFDMLDRSVSLSTANVLERSFFIFRTALEAQENIAIRAVDTYSKSGKKLGDKRALTEDLGSVMASAFSVAVWKRGLRWALATGATTALAAFGIFKFKDPENDKMSERISKDTLKNIVRLNKFGKFAVEIGERIADSLTGEGYNWNRNSFDNPILDVLQTGAEVPVAITRAIQDAGLLDEFVEEVTSKADEQFNEQLAKRIIRDVKNAMETSFEFGVRITGLPVLAPVQEFLRPLLVESKISIINEVTFGDVENPKDFSERVFALYEKRKELNRESKTRRLSRQEEQALSRLNKFTNSASKLTEAVQELSDPNQRKLRFTLFDIKLRMTEERVKDID